jgi:large subunit ribosomal protein L28
LDHGLFIIRQLALSWQFAWLPDKCYNSILDMGFDYKYPRVASTGNNVSHAKNRTKRKFKYNLHTVTVIDDNGDKKRLRVPTGVLRKLKKAGVTTHYQNRQENQESE